MFAVIEIGGQQFKVQKDQKILVNRLEQSEGEQVSIDNVLLVDKEDGNVQIGNPAIENAQVSAKVFAHQKGDKVIIFKKKRRKGYKKKQGHRQLLTQLQIEDIVA